MLGVMIFFGVRNSRNGVSAAYLQAQREARAKANGLDTPEQAEYKRILKLLERDFRELSEEEKLLVRNFKRNKKAGIAHPGAPTATADLYTPSTATPVVERPNVSAPVTSYTPASIPTYNPGEMYPVVSQAPAPTSVVSPAATASLWDYTPAAATMPAPSSDPSQTFML
eukprot:gnl/Ergobibamus_cyprinoides/614.p2 GENE.gnl/Ergobibamus_cyprinoides/614~~gnl/Ergobibamus_cyprinoides/614.p2  ORF type:complete len:169 (-),score=28.00 gnl/Ergobibamus_cyprinoides/614:500-1006(-)